MRLRLGDAVKVMQTLPDNSVDAVVTDPPYGLEFMGKAWDRPWAVGMSTTGYTDGAERLERPAFGDSRNANCKRCGGRQRGAKTCVCAKPKWDRDPAEDMKAFGAWSLIWATEAYRVLKPGGFILAFGGTRTAHRLGCAIEDAGFEIRDSIAWLYGSGFPKSQDVSKAIDKAAGVTFTAKPAAGVGFMNPEGRNGYNVTRNQLTRSGDTTSDAEQWEGWGTALKPAHEPIVMGRKPFTGTVAANVQRHGTGAINIDATRIGTEVRVNPPGSTNPRVAMGDGWRTDAEPREATGRWPANVVLDESQAAALDEQSGVLSSGMLAAHHKRAPKEAGILGAFDAVEGARGFGDTGGASRFFYCAKASKKERPKVDGQSHPTVKPLTLMRWLVRLVCPPGGTVLDPFIGSGATVEACLFEGFSCIGIDSDPLSLRLTHARLAAAHQ